MRIVFEYKTFNFFSYKFILNSVTYGNDTNINFLGTVSTEVLSNFNLLIVLQNLVSINLRGYWFLQKTGVNIPINSSVNAR